ncbi:hypothetical protein [Campylobacter suis]|uniref:Uncharacterized protein n=1 Tax=Campylobacter suis TaxID=2790657 RepID=A0ABM8Q5Z3_9BACT|nr:hypothetical protein [Campylobacter suis]CAD7288247.1 hypothetical protein LMG8286_01215 [Campylobacter suis]
MIIPREVKAVHLHLINEAEFIISAVDDNNNLIGNSERIAAHKLSLVKNFIDKTNKKRKEMADMSSKGLF